MLRVWGAERGEAVPGWAWGAGLGKAAPGLELDAYLHVTTAERFTSYLSGLTCRSGVQWSAPPPAPHPRPTAPFCLRVKRFEILSEARFAWFGESQ